MAYLIRIKKNDSNRENLLWDWQHLHESILEGEGLEEGLSTWRFRYGDKFPEVIAWFDREINRAETYREDKARARAEKRLAEHFAGDDWAHLALVWDELKKYPDLRQYYQALYNFPFSPHEWNGYAVHFNRRSGKYLVKGLYRQADIKHLRHRCGGYNWQYEARQHLDNPFYAGKGWKEHYIGEPFPSQYMAQEFIGLLHDLHLQFKVEDFYGGKMFSVIDFADWLSLLLIDFYEKPFEVQPGQKHGPYTVLRYGDMADRGFVYDAWFCRHEEHGEIPPKQWEHHDPLPYWLSEGELRQEHFKEEVLDLLFTWPLEKAA